MTDLVRSPTALWRRTALGILVRTADGPLVALEGTGIVLWDLLAEPATTSQLAADLAVVFDVDPEVVARDIEPAIQELLGSGILEARDL